MRIREYAGRDEEQVLKLWQRCGRQHPESALRMDISRKLELQPDLFLVGEVKQTIVSALMAGYEGHRGWIHFVAVAPEFQRLGYGRALVNEAEERLTSLGCPRIQINVRTNNRQVLGFCERLGYQIDRVVCMAKNLDACEQPQERTASQLQFLQR